MLEESNKIFCEKCGTLMKRVDRQRIRSIGMFSGTTETISTSSSHPLTTVTSITAPPPYTYSPKEPHRQFVARIIKYVCPSCGRELQKREY